MMERMQIVKDIMDKGEPEEKESCYTEGNEHLSPSDHAHKHKDQGGVK